MKIRRGFVIIFILTFIVVSVAATWYINKYVAPTVLKNLFIRSISEFVDRPVDLESIRVDIFRGFTLRGLTIYEPDEESTFLQIDRLTTSLLFIPLLKERKIIVPSIKIEAPLISLSRNKDKSWNFLKPPLIKKMKDREALKKQGFIVLVQNISFEKGEISFTDNSKSSPCARQLIDLNGKITLSQQGIAHINISAQLSSPNETGISLKGTYKIKEKLWELETEIEQLSVVELYNYFHDFGFPAVLKSGTASAKITIKIDKDKKIYLDTNTSLANIDILYKKYNLKGDLDLSGNSTLDLRETFKTDYNLAFDLKKSSLSGIPLLDELSGLLGTIKISNQSITTEYLEGYAHNTLIKAKGGIKNLTDARLEITAQSNLDLENYRRFLTKDLKTKFKDILLRGNADITIKYSDVLKDLQPGPIEAIVKLNRASVRTPNMQEKLKNISGYVKLKNNIYYLSRIFFDFGNQNYLLDGKVSGLDPADAKIKLDSDILTLDSRFQVSGGKVHILRASGKYHNSTYKLSGDIRDFKSMDTLIKGKIGLNLIDLRKMVPKIAPVLEKYDVKGLCNLEYYINGPFGRLKDLVLKVKGEADYIKVLGLRFDYTKLDLKMNNLFIAVPELSARPYNGIFDSTIDIDLAPDNPRYGISVNTGGIDLSKLILDTEWKNRKMSGRGMAKLAVRGFGGNLETMNGNGLISIEGGYLWEMPFLRGLANVLFMPQLSTIVFDHASANFIVSNKTVSTSNLVLHSKNVTLLGEGGVSFDGAIDLDLTSSVAEDFIKGTSDFAQIANILFAQAGQFIGNIKVRGTLAKPEFKLIPVPIDKILKNRLQEVLGGFF